MVDVLHMPGQAQQVPGNDGVDLVFPCQHRDAGVIGGEHQATLTVLAAAITARKASAAHRAAVTEHQAAQHALPGVREALADADAELTTATDKHQAVVRQEAAHTAGLGLRPGDGCRVFSRPLSEDYQTPAALDPDRLARTTAALGRAHQARGRAEGAHASATATEKKALRQVTAAEQERDRARRRLNESIAQAAQAAGSPDLRPAAAQPHPFDAEAFLRALHRAVELSQQDGGVDAPEPPDQVATARRLCSDAATHSETIAASASQALSDAQQAANAAEAATTLLSNQRQDLTQRVTAHQAEQTAHTHAATALQERAQALPAAVRSALPTPLQAIRADDLTGIRRLFGELTAEIDTAAQQRHHAATDLTAVSKERLRLERQRQSDLTEPLLGLLATATSDLTSAQAARTVLSAPPLQALDPPDPVTVEAVHACCKTAAEAVEEPRDRLTRARTDAQTRRSGLLADLHTQAQQLRSLDAGGPLAAFGDGLALEEPRSLEPPVREIGIARDTRTRQAALAATAEAQIEPARALDAAISAGKARLATLTALHRHLAPGSFPSYLTQQRTKALLGLAGTLFERLTAGRYGFSDEFRIVTMDSKTVRSPKTLSGGETFLASLALALVELHSRNGARLGSLFLDEGFGALDSAALASHSASCAARATTTNWSW
ncbi:hypothetical protein HUT06_21330 [Actinomadura sp. NAK00032]|uniref:SbcC/MukB-like Walker B domain-containing protein n=1 Tax=Actinomadura sp. NAK00032 TaxID=2742128 RepID=UPI001590E499|nr:SbcC/MukB-like Walker B domain-containing protein [Actinomadura sp. NAK00032]QKW36262.1 hypothetical protein HUT06_21330 [Actinomadura sp. NAK00032]